jgi:cation:H+ antiporter
MELHPSITFLAGLIIIIVGAELLLRGASHIATLLKIKPIIIGLTVVSVGTSMPELAVGITAATEGKGTLAVGNIAGTNIFNILFILGLSAVIRPLPLHLLSIKLDVPVMIATALVLIAMAWDGILSQAEGLALISAALIYTVALIQLSKRESTAMRHEFAEEYGADSVTLPAGIVLPKTRFNIGLWNGLLLTLGIFLTVLGAELMVTGATGIALPYGVSDAVIGLTIVAIGTSAPEIASTMLATLKNDRDVAIGNLIGSGIYNVLVILGITSAVAHNGINVSDEILMIDLPLAAMVAIICLPVFKTDRLVSRREGLFFVICYLIYFSSLLLLRT